MYSVLRSVMIVAGAEQRRHSRDIDEVLEWKCVLLVGWPLGPAI